MQTSILPAALLLLITTPHAAQDALNVHRVSRVPAIMRAQIPRGGVTRFCGRAPIVPGGRETWLHFYRIPTRRRAPSDAANPYEFNPHDYVLGVFGRTGAQRRARLRLSNSVRMSGDKFFQQNHTTREFESVTAHILWLRPATRQTPILWLRCAVNNSSIAAPYENDILITFTHALSGQTSAQDFDDSSAYAWSIQNSYDKTDESGMLVITRKTHGGDSPRYTEERWRWNGRAFVLAGQAEFAFPSVIPAPPM